MAKLDTWGSAIGRVSALIVGPIFLAWMIAVTISGHQYLVDFTHSFLPASTAVLHGHTPYDTAHHLRHLIAAGTPVESYVYPPVVAIVISPLSVIPQAAAMVIYTGLMLAALGGAMWLLGVRDVRCYTVTCLWPATFTSFQTGAISGFILLGLAAAWRWRRHELRIGAIAAVVVAAKLFVWPVGLWLIVTCRYRAAVAAAITFPALVLGSWAVIAFRGLGSYEHLLGILSNAESPLGFGIGGVAAATGVPQALLTACAAAAVVGMFAWLHRLAPPQLDRLAMMAAVLAMLLLSPILWMHYLILLVIPLALGRPGFSRLWVLPAVFQFASIVTTQGVYPDGNPVALCLCWCGIAAVVWCSAAPMLRARTPVSAVAVGLARS